MGVAKVRAHRGILTEFKRLLRLNGIALDSELAHKIIATAAPVGDPMRETIERVRNHVLAMPRRQDLTVAWERDHPDRSPYPPSFAERVLQKLRDAESEMESSEASVPFAFTELRLMCEAELDDDLWIANPMIDPRSNN